MLNWLKRMFTRPQETASIPEKPESLDMRTNPTNNPFDYREDGSIRPGDPAYDALMESLMSGKTVIGNQRPDGTWNTQYLD